MSINPKTAIHLSPCSLATLSSSVSCRSAADRATTGPLLPRAGGGGFAPRAEGVTTGGGVPPRPRGRRGGRGGGGGSEINAGN